MDAGDENCFRRHPCLDMSVDRSLIPEPVQQFVRVDCIPTRILESADVIDGNQPVRPASGHGTEPPPQSSSAVLLNQLINHCATCPPRASITKHRTTGLCPCRTVRACLSQARSFFLHNVTLEWHEVSSSCVDSRFGAPDIESSCRRRRSISRSYRFW